MKRTISILIPLFLLSTETFCQNLLLTKAIDSTHNTVVAIMRLDSTGKMRTRATGVLIHPNVILTAGHVNYTGTIYPDGLKRDGFISFSNKALQGSEYVPFDWIDDVTTHIDQADFKRSMKDTTGKLDPNDFLDIGLIFLKSPVQNRPTSKLPQPLLFTKLPERATFLGVGYGYHRIRDSSFKHSFIDGVRRKWKPQSVSAINDKWLTGACDTVTKQQFMNTGDSGSPLFLDNNTIIAIAATAGMYPMPAGFVRIDNPIVLDWIKKTVKQRLGIDLQQ